MSQVSNDTSGYNNTFASGNVNSSGVNPAAVLTVCGIVFLAWYFWDRYKKDEEKPDPPHEETLRVMQQQNTELRRHIIQQNNNLMNHVTNSTNANTIPPNQGQYPGQVPLADAVIQGQYPGQITQGSTQPPPAGKGGSAHVDPLLSI